MNNNSILGFLANLKIFLSLWRGHDKSNLSYTPILLLEPKNFRGVLDFEDNLMTEYVIKCPVVYFLSSVSTLKNPSDICVIRHIISKIIGT